MAGLTRIEPPKKGEDTADLWKIVVKLCGVINALITNVTVVQGSDTTGRLDIAEGNAVLTLPKVAGGGSGNALGQVWIDVNVSGQAEYMLINGSAPVSVLPAGATVVNPD